MSIWDDPEVRPDSDYVKFEQPGDNVSGDVLAISVHRFDDGKTVPKLQLRTADGDRTLTAGQVRLRAALAEQRPEAGDHLTVTLTRIESRPAGRSLKHFDVQVTRGGPAKPAVLSPTPPPPQQPAGTAPELTPDVRALIAQLATKNPAVTGSSAG